MSELMGDGSTTSSSGMRGRVPSGDAAEYANKADEPPPAPPGTKPPEALAPEGGASPLAEADPASLDEFIMKRCGEVFNKPPGDLTADDLSVCGRYYRAERQRYAKEAKGVGPLKPRKKAPKSIQEALDMSVLD